MLKITKKKLAIPVQYEANIWPQQLISLGPKRFPQQDRGINPPQVPPRGCNVCKMPQYDSVR